MTSKDKLRAEKALEFAVGHINVSMPCKVTAQSLLDALKSKTIEENDKFQVEAFLDETDVGLLSDMKRGGLITYRELAEKANALLPSGHEVRKWLDEHL
jgi:hypothetical protein